MFEVETGVSLFECVIQDSAVACGCVDAAAAAAADSYSQDDQVSSTSATMHVTVPTAVYAVVSRNRTAPSQSNPSTSSSSAADSIVTDAATADARRDLYTRVIRRQDGRRTSPSTGQSLTIEPRSSVGLSGDGYARIDEPPRQPQLPQNYSNSNVDFYDVIRDDVSVAASSDFDPNYESVPQTTAAPVDSTTNSSVNCVTASSGGSGSGTTVSGSAGGGQHRLDTAVTASVSSDTSSGQQTEPTRHRGFLIREHIYDEVSSPTTKCTTTITHSDV